MCHAFFGFLDMFLFFNSLVTFLLSIPLLDYSLFRSGSHVIFSNKHNLYPGSKNLYTVCQARHPNY